jgi:hypothetical protein
MALHGVEGKGHAHAEDGADEKCGKYQLVRPSDHIGGPGQQPDEHADEGDTAYKYK